MSQAARQRSRWAVPVLVALVGSILALPAIPAAGADGEADELATYSACVGPAVESAGFRDLQGYSDETEEAINCLAHYDITQGISTGDFDPDSEVTRWQMALFPGAGGGRGWDPTSEAFRSGVPGHRGSRC